MKSDKLYIDQILDSIQKIESYTKNISNEDFLKNSLVQSGVIMQLILIGETSKKISEEMKSITNLPWKNIAGFRDRAVHDYFELDLEFIWLTLRDDLPQLKNVLLKK
jgi:uncharacterized protein with HEPN domain